MKFKSMDATTPTPHQEVVETDKDYIDNESVSSQTSGSTSKRSSSEGSTRGHKSFVRDHLCQRGVVVCFVLSLSAVGIYFLTIFLIDRSEHNEFKVAFELFALETADLAKHNSESVVGQVQTLSTAITAWALQYKKLSTNDTFPNVTLPLFDRRVQEIVELTGIEMVLFAPFVDASDQEGWIEYMAGDKWLEEDYAYRGWDFSLIQDRIPNHISLLQDAIDETHIHQSSTVAVSTPKESSDHKDDHDHRYLQDEEVELLIFDDHANETNVDFQEDDDHDENDVADHDADHNENVDAGHDEDHDEDHDYHHDEDHHDEEHDEDHDDEQSFDAALVQNGYTPQGLTVPVGQAGPALINPAILKMDLFSIPEFAEEMVHSMKNDAPILSNPMNLNFLMRHVVHEDDRVTHNGSTDGLRSFVLDSVKDDFTPDARAVGFVVGVVPWSNFFENVLPLSLQGLVIVAENRCGGDTYTYVANGDSNDWSLAGDHHDSKYDDMAYRADWYEEEEESVEGGHAHEAVHCHTTLAIYPSEDFEATFKTQSSNVVGVSIAAGLVVIMLLFCIFNWIVRRQQRAVQEKADRAEAIVASVFPKGIGQRLIAEAGDNAKGSNNHRAATRGLLQNFLDHGHDDQTKPIADLFPSTTVLFADIVGFTAWSSTRDPADVFRLLEAIYSEFDKLSKRRGVYKVETVGDCYVAVSGLPEPRKDHFVAASRLARDIVTRMSVVTTQLETELGPDTTELGIRVGLHSGPVTAGVLRGDRARFQLFGDTVNTTARIESTGAKNRIHTSKETAELLKAAGKGHWVTPREEQVEAKGKGKLATFWLDPHGAAQHESSIDTASSTSDEHEQPVAPESQSHVTKDAKKTERLIQWNVDVLFGILQKTASYRRSAGVVPDSAEAITMLENELQGRRSEDTIVDEVVDTIDRQALPDPSKPAADLVGESNDSETEQLVVEQLKEYVSTIADMYNPNAFHNFEHASHVTMSVTKLLGRIDTPVDGTCDLGDFICGLTNDPLTQFAVVLSALLHDVDHPGVPNTQLVQEGSDMSALYKNQSIAEQNSIDLAWDLLMEDRYQDLRFAIYTTTADLKRFRQLLVNIILATDVMDPSLRELRNARWNKAFAAADSTPTKYESNSSQQLQLQSDRKAVIVLEHLIQASDVSHTMQHWQVYRKWNAKLFMEMYRAYKNGRSDKDPSEFWYKGEIGFFDYYVIPLAKKLEECGVFGVSSDEYLNYAVQNRNEWEAKGESVVEELKQMVKDEMS